MGEGAGFHFGIFAEIGVNSVIIANMTPEYRLANLSYLVLMADLVDSRQLNDREAVQDRLQEAVQAFNAWARRQNHLAEPTPGDAVAEALAAAEALPPVGRGMVGEAAISAGDEVQALFRHSKQGGLALVEGIKILMDHLHPVPLTFGIGLGPVTTRLQTPVTLVDGPCFHRARAALLATKGRSYRCRVSGFPKVQGQALDALLALLGAYREGWTDKQAAYARAAAVPGRLRKEVAELFQVSPSVVTESLQAAHFDEFSQGLDAVAAMLGWHSGAPDSGATVGEGATS